MVFGKSRAIEFQGYNNKPWVRKGRLPLILSIRINRRLSDEGTMSRRTPWRCIGVFFRDLRSDSSRRVTIALFQVFCFQTTYGGKDQPQSFWSCSLILECSKNPRKRDQPGLIQRGIWIRSSPCLRKSSRMRKITSSEWGPCTYRGGGTAIF